MDYNQDIFIYLLYTYKDLHTKKTDRKWKHQEKTKRDVALFHEFLVLKSEKREMDELTPQELDKVSGFHHCIYICFQDVILF